MFPYIGCMSLVALAAGILNTWKRFAVPAATPVLLNLAMITAAWQGAPLFARWGLDPILALAAGVMAGGVLQAAIQLPALRAIGCLPRFALGWGSLRRAWTHPGVRRVLGLMAPALLGVSVAQISLLINTQIASHVGVGAVSGDLCRPADGVPTACSAWRWAWCCCRSWRRRRRARTCRPIPTCSTGACACWCCWRCRARWR
jgi:putative peptidoglycan lipid II flippase